MRIHTPNPSVHGILPKIETLLRSIIFSQTISLDLVYVKQSHDIIVAEMQRELSNHMEGFSDCAVCCMVKWFIKRGGFPYPNAVHPNPIQYILNQWHYKAWGIITTKLSFSLVFSSLLPSIPLRSPAETFAYFIEEKIGSSKIQGLCEEFRTTPFNVFARKIMNLINPIRISISSPTNTASISPQLNISPHRESTSILA